MNLGENPILSKQVESEGELKSWLVDYVGNKKSPEDDGVTVEMIIDVVSEEFPEFLMAFAEENWVRGYHQALEDVSEGEKIAMEELEKKECDDESCGQCECD